MQEKSIVFILDRIKERFFIDLEGKDDFCSIYKNLALKLKCSEDIAFYSLFLVRDLKEVETKNLDFIRRFCDFDDQYALDIMDLNEQEFIELQFLSERQ